MFYSRICILTDESVTPLQMKEFKKELCEVMKEIFSNTRMEVDLVLDVFKKRGTAVGGLDNKEMDEILENFDLSGDAIIC